MDEIGKIVNEEINKIIYALGANCFNFNPLPVQKSDALEIIDHIQNYFKKSAKNHEQTKSFCNDRVSYIPNYQEANSNLIFDKDTIEDCTEIPFTNPSISILHEIVSENSENNIQYIDDVYSICNAIEKKSPHFPTDLHEILIDEAEPDQILTDPVKKDQLSEDSGIFSDKSSDESCGNAKAVPDVVKNNTYEPEKLNLSTVDALNNLLENLKKNIDSSAGEVVFNWKNSLVEYNCSLICKLSLKGAEYEACVQNFIVDLLNEIWSDGQLNQHANWKQKISIICKLLTTPSICLEVLCFTIDIFNNVNTAVLKGYYSSFLIVKVALFLEMYPIVARTLHLLLRPLQRTPSKTVSVAKLWQEKLSCVKHVDNYHQEVIEVIKVDIIPKLVSFFLSCTGNKEPLVSLATKEALDELENLCRE